MAVMFLVLMCALTVVAAAILVGCVRLGRRHRHDPLFAIAFVVGLIASVATVAFLAIFLSYAIGAIIG
ncbi:hypothetical protein Uis1B_0677 [Bifidobacterium margollesii]|uniref:Uncharacterized protein n=2 Tax=Bifidobacterium margollesii TaxID=2020964 RepID=A0A2N5JB88_9BIFI|nr:hypothetical protein Uis1B_0677 [Bifidobacterium margollesii]